MPKLKKFNLKRRWINARPGSVLILVIALLVLLALIGTAYLSSTQTERYTSQQNTINTEADLLIQGMVNTVNAKIVNSLFGTVNGVSAYRPPATEQPYQASIATPISVTSTGYFNYVSACAKPKATPLATDADPACLFLADRIPSNATPQWSSISWPLFKDVSSENTFDSPLPQDQSFHMGMASGRANFTFRPTSTNLTLANGTNLTLPAMQILQNLQTGSNPDGTQPPAMNATIYAADTDGDGIADALFCKVPVGQIDGVTYYVATRVVDGNSAINVSSAFSQGPDDQFGTQQPNYGFFRSNIGLYELLNSTARDAEMDALNTYRYGATFSGTGSQPSTGGPALSAASPTSFQDPTVGPFTASNGTVINCPTNFNWYTYGDIFENVLTRRPGNPGYAAQGAGQSQWLGMAASSRLAYKFALSSPYLTPSTLEQYLLPAELYTNSRSVPYSPGQAGQWYNDLFSNLNSYSGSGSNSGPLRTVLTGSNPVSNAAPTRVGNSSAITPPIWSGPVSGRPAPYNVPTVYKFGDWVTDGASTTSPQRSYVCIRQHTSNSTNEPGTGINVAGAVGYWAGVYATTPTASVVPGMPFSQQVTKTSVNTATFEQLWVAFAQVMTDNIGPDPLTSISEANSSTMQQWLPPMQQQGGIQPGTEPQMGMFRSVLRTPQAAAADRTILTASQMLQLRAALAAVNTLDLRDSDDDVSSRSIVLTDGTTGAPAYTVEVYGTEKQPYISELFIQTDGTPGAASTNNYIALELCNPYPAPITLTNWQIGYMNRASFASGMTMTALPITPPLTIPAAVNGRPGLLILQEGTQPTDVATQITDNQGSYASCTLSAQPTTLVGLFNAALGAANQPNEIFLMRPRRADGAQTSSSGGGDVFSEAANIADNVPVDQMDLTGLTIPSPSGGGAGPGPGGGGGGGGGGATPPPTRFLYRRGNGAFVADATGLGTTPAPWHFIYPGYYNPAGAAGKGAYFQQIGAANPAIQTDPTGKAKCFLAGPTFTYGTSNFNATYNTLPIVLNNTNMAGPNPVTAAGNVFPFGQFSRQADMLQIPFIGAYRIRATALNDSQLVSEMNSVTIDSALAYDNTPSPDSLSSGGAQPDAANGSGTPLSVFNEQIGRFCPVGDPSAADPPHQMDFGPGYATGAVAGSQQKVYWHYHWARRLFDYLTVQSPQDDYFPNVDPAQANTFVTPNQVNAKYPDTAAATPPVPVVNNSSSLSLANTQTAGSSEDTVGVEGLININTAPVAVLAQLPFPQSANETNAQIATGIVNYRNTNGPFRSIYDLYRVPEFFTASHNPTSPYPVGPSQGVFSPYGLGTITPPATVALPMDFLQDYYALNKISNLITTRSDTFTCYILLQGWRNVGTSNPALVVQRRAAHILDLTPITPQNNLPTVFKVPTD